MASTIEQTEEKIRANIKIYRKKLGYTHLQLSIKTGYVKISYMILKAAEEIQALKLYANLQMHLRLNLMNY